MIAVAILFVASLIAASATVRGVGSHAGVQVLAAGLSLVLMGYLAWRAAFPGRNLPKNRIRNMRMRTRFGLRTGPGHATGYECWNRWGRFAAFRRSKRARPSLSRACRYFWPSEHAFLVGLAYRWHRMFVPSEEHALIMAPPRTRKTGLLAKIILRWPGPVVATSTKADLFALTSGIRQRRGPIHVFNPQGVGGVPSTFRWNPLAGCEDESVAIRRADAFANAVSQKGVEDGGFWAAKASDCLRAFFHAAAVGGRSLADVWQWCLTGDITQATLILRQHGNHEWADQVEELAGEAAKTAATIRMTCTRALSFLADPKLAAAVQPAAGAGFNILAFLDSGGTLYLIAENSSADNEAPVSALFACLASEVRHVAALLGSAMPGERFDPPLLMALDEATQICPCPIPNWVADSGGKGITIITVCHGEAQLEARWKATGRQTIMDCAGVIIWMPGITDPKTLDSAAKLTGETAYEQRGPRGEPGQRHYTQHQIMTDAMIRQVPRCYAMAVRGDLSPVIIRIPVAWRDWRYLLAKATGRDVAKVTATAAATTPGPADRPLVPVPAGSREWSLDDHFRTASRVPGAGQGGNGRANGHSNGHDGAS